MKASEPTKLLPCEFCGFPHNLENAWSIEHLDHIEARLALLHMGSGDQPEEITLSQIAQMAGHCREMKSKLRTRIAALEAEHEAVEAAVHIKWSEKNVQAMMDAHNAAKAAR